MKNLYNIYSTNTSSDKTLEGYKRKLLNNSENLNVTYKETKKLDNWVGYQSSPVSERLDSDSEHEENAQDYIEKLAKGVSIDANPRKIKQKEFVSGENINWLGEKPTHIESHSITPLNNSKTIYRDSNGVVINEKNAEKINPNVERLKLWAGGEVQREEQESLQERIEKEKTKPFARHEIDSDYQFELKKRPRFGDPVADFAKINQKKSKFSWENRFSIQPGKMWDGVDRTNGFEQRWLAKQGRKVWENSVAYKNFASEL